MNEFVDTLRGSTGSLAAERADFERLLAEMSWIDLTAIGIVLVFFVVGLFRGMIWQVSRVATLVGAYFVAGWFGTGLARWTATWFPDGIAPEIPHYVAYFLIFLGCLIVLGTVSAWLHAVVQRSPLSFYNRVGGGLLGVATGWLIVMALLTALHMASGATGLGTSIASAASNSRSQRFSDTVLQHTTQVLPPDWRHFTTRWRELLRGDESAPPQKEPGAEHDRGPESPDRAR